MNDTKPLSAERFETAPDDNGVHCLVTLREASDPVPSLFAAAYGFTEEVAADGARRIADALNAQSPTHTVIETAELERLRERDAQLTRLVDDTNLLSAQFLSERDALREALKKAEAALADIGDADREPADDLAWCEKRAAQALPIVRAALASAGEQK